MALTGNNFCRSCVGAFKVISSNPVRYALVDGIGDLLVLIGKAFVSLTTSYIGYLIIVNSPVKDKLVGVLLPIVLFGLIGFLVADVFLKIFDIATEAIL